MLAKLFKRFAARPGAAPASVSAEPAAPRTSVAAPAPAPSLAAVKAPASAATLPGPAAVAHASPFAPGLASAPAAADAASPSFAPAPPPAAPVTASPLQAAQQFEREGRLAEAERLLRAQAADLDDIAAQDALGAFLLRQRRLDEARALLLPALDRFPGSPSILFTCGHLAQLSLQVDRAIELFRLVLAVEPHHAGARFHLATQLFLKGELREGFLHLRARRELPGHNTPYWAATIAPWRGESLAGKRLLIAPDWGGLGDEIQFARYIELIHRDYQPASLHVAASQECLRLIEAIPGVEHAFFEVGAVSADYHIGLMDIPCVYGTELESVPARPRYLGVAPAEAAYWQRRLGAAQGAGLRIGLCWSAAYWGGAAGGRSDKSLPLSLLAPLGALPGARFISLQKGSGRDELPCPGMAIEDYSADLEDLADTAALMENLDVVVTVDTSVAHLAGALGKPVIMLLKWDSGMFWLLERDTSPWYPTLRIVRQTRPGDWAEVCARVLHLLREWPLAAR